MMSGTSLSSPHVAGAAALIMQSGSFTASGPAAVMATITKMANAGVVSGSLNGAPNLVAYNNATASS